MFGLQSFSLQVVVPEPSVFALGLLGGALLALGPALAPLPRPNEAHTFSAVNRSGIQWWKFQLNSTGTPRTYSTGGMIYDGAASNPYWYYMPSVAVNWQNELLLGFSGSSSNSYISAYYTGRMADGTFLAQPVLIKPGTAYDGAYGFWGDYSYTSVDPIDNQTFWTVQSYATSTRKPWSDWILSVKPGP